MGLITTAVKIYNSVGTLINLSTEEKQDDLINYTGSLWALNVQVDSGDANVTYVGIAVPSTAAGAALWQIKKIDETTGTVITWADGNTNFDNVFTNRESLSYS